MVDGFKNVRVCVCAHNIEGFLRCLPNVFGQVPIRTSGAVYDVKTGRKSKEK